jgi:transposase
MRDLGLTPSAYASGARRRQGGITTAGHPYARRALVEGAWAYRSPANVGSLLPLRLQTLPTGLQDIRWQTPVRPCQRYRQRSARGKHAKQVVVAIARELAACRWAIAPQVPVTPYIPNTSGFVERSKSVAVHR